MPRGGGSSRTGALASALTELYFDIRSNYREYASAISATIVFPVLLGALFSFGAVYSLRWLQRQWGQPSRTARQLHKEALAEAQSLQRTEHVLRLLVEALKKDPDYEPARLSLAAMYVYRLGEPDMASEVLEHCSSAAAKAIRLDAQALEKGAGHMIQTILREDSYLSVRYADTAALQR